MFAPESISVVSFTLLSLCVLGIYLCCSDMTSVVGKLYRGSASTPKFTNTEALMASSVYLSTSQTLGIFESF